MPLTIAAEVQPYAAAIKDATAARRMPPWYAAPGCNEYLEDRSLSQEQIDEIGLWATNGAPLGDPADEPPPLPEVRGDMSRVDLRLVNPQPYTPRTRPDEYRCFVLDWPATTNKFITGIGVTPGVVPMVHHAIAYLMAPASVASVRQRDASDPAPGYSCVGGIAGGWLTSWEPGGHGLDFPHDTGIPVDPGSVIVLQIHYNTQYAEPTSDQSSVEFELADSASLPAHTITWMDPFWPLGTMSIPPNSADVEHEYQGSATMTAGASSFKIHWADIHMHTLGTRGDLRVVHADGTSECLLHVDAYSFSHQETFLLKDSVQVLPGDQLRVECHWNNPTTRTVNWGEKTSDEMCLGNFLISQ